MGYIRIEQIPQLGSRPKWKGIGNVMLVFADCLNPIGSFPIPAPSAARSRTSDPSFQARSVGQVSLHSVANSSVSSQEQALQALLKSTCLGNAVFAEGVSFFGGQVETKQGGYHHLEGSAGSKIAMHSGYGCHVLVK